MRKHIKPRGRNDGTLSVQTTSLVVLNDVSPLPRSSHYPGHTQWHLGLQTHTGNVSLYVCHSPGKYSPCLCALRSLLSCHSHPRAARRRQGKSANHINTQVLFSLHSGPESDSLRWTSLLPFHRGAQRMQCLDSGNSPEAPDEHWCHLKWIPLPVLGQMEPGNREQQ